MPYIDVRGLTVKYPRTTRPALQRVGFSLERGQTALLLGASGSGKSTVGLCLAGLIPESIPAKLEGEIAIDGRDLSTLTIGQRTAQVGIVFQDPEAQFCMLTVEDEVAFGLENMAVPREAMTLRIAQALAQVGLSARRTERVDRLSGGQKQRLALACALARGPAILFLDEPTANLDPAARSDFFDLLATLRRTQPGLTIIVVEHVLDDLVRMVDRVILLGYGGVLQGIGRPEEMFDRQSAQLDRMGVWLPQVTALGHKLRQAGLDLPGLPLTVEQAAAQLAPRLATRDLGKHPRVKHPHVHRARTDEPESARLAIRVHELSHRYRTGPQVLHRVSLDVPSGAFFALVGPNGSGKTTLASHLVSILSPAPGSVYLLGQDITALSTAQITDRMGYVFQNPEHQFVEQRVDDELAYSLRLRGRPPEVIESIVADLLASFGLKEHRQQNPFSLSQGQKRRLSVATMLAVGQSILILDEPTFGQDRHTAQALMARLCELQRQGVTILAITHDMQLVADYAEQVGAIVGGHIRYVGRPEGLFARDELLEAAALRPPPLHTLAGQLGVHYSDGTRPMTIREWLPCFGLLADAARGERRHVVAQDSGDGRRG